MDTFAPLLQNNETLYSWITRWALLSGYPSGRSAIKCLFGNDNMQLTSSFPSNLPQIQGFSDQAPKQLINKHTILPFFKAFLDEDVYKNAVLAMLSGRTDHLYSRLSLLANRLPMFQAMRYCPICTQHDYLTFGHTYWHVSHQLPAITVCTKHSVNLIGVEIARRELVLPPSPEDIGVIEDVTSAKEFKFCELLRQVLEVGSRNLTPEKLNSCYIKALCEIDLASANGSIRMDKLRSEIRQYWQDGHSGDFAKLLELVFSGNGSFIYPAPLFYQKTSHHHPVKHLLLIGLLFESWEGFLIAFHNKSQWGDVTPEHSTYVIEPKYSVESIREKNIIEYLRASYSMRSIAKRFNATLTTVKKIAFLNNISVESRAQKIFANERNSIIRLAEKGLAASSIADKFNCSTAAVEQIITQTKGLVEKRKLVRFNNKREKHRNKIREAKKCNVRRTDIQRKVRASYTWLFRNDKDWLYLNLPNEVPRSKRYSR
jgi:predicted transcriptional regulator